MKKALAAAALAAGLLAGCAATAPSVSLTGTTWMLEIDAETECEVPPTIAFDEGGRVHGSLGCNSFFGEAVIDGSSIAFERVGSTRRMCAPAFMELENRMLSAINGVKTFRASADRLVFLGRDGSELAAFVPEKAGRCR